MLQEKLPPSHECTSLRRRRVEVFLNISYVEYNMSEIKVQRYIFEVIAGEGVVCRLSCFLGCSTGGRSLRWQCRG